MIFYLQTAAQSMVSDYFIISSWSFTVGVIFARELGNWIYQTENKFMQRDKGANLSNYSSVIKAETIIHNQALIFAYSTVISWFTCQMQLIMHVRAGN